jgi:hypothetical protein
MIKDTVECADFEEAEAIRDRFLINYHPYGYGSRAVIERDDRPDRQGYLVHLSRFHSCD